MDIRFTKTIPANRHADVVVAGGGIAGISAAIAASRRGAYVMLIEQNAVTGGNATSGGVAAFCGETAGQGEVFDLIISSLEQWNAIAPYRPFDQCEARIFDHEILAFILQELLLRHNIKLLLHTKVADVITSGERIEQLIIDGPSGLEAISGQVFIDCTGEAVIAHHAGFATEKGRPGDHAQLPMSLMYFVRHLEDGDHAPVLPDGWVDKLTSESELPMTSIWPNGPHSNAIKIKVPLGDSTDTDSFTEVEIRARRRMMQVLDYHRRREGKNWMLDHCSPVIGIREGRRITGEYILQVDDLRAGRKFEDAIARGVFYLDGHNPEDDKRTYILPKDELKVPPYQIPLRSLLAKDSVNLLTAGRGLSADQLALSSARVMTTCAMTGQAAGITAAKAVAENTNIKNVAPLEVRREVERKGAIL